jgi:hypothetical protein
MDKLEFAKCMRALDVKIVLEETTKNCYPGRQYATNHVGLVGYWAPKIGYTVFKEPMKRFSTTRRTFKKIKLEDL